MKNLKPSNRTLTKLFATVLLTLVMGAVGMVFCFAAGNQAVNSINNLSSFLWTIMKLVGMMMIGFGILQFGMSLQAHDPSQRSQGILFIVGGILIAFAEQIVKLIAS